MRALAVLALCGCDSLLGLDHVPAQSDAATDAAIDSSTRTIQCDYEWQVASVGSDGTPSLATQPAPVTYAHAIANGMQVPIASDGTFQFTARDGQPYELAFQSAGNIAFFDRNAETCHLVGNFLHRLGSAPASQPTQVRFDIPGVAPANTVVRIASTGERTYSAPTFSMTNSWSVDWQALLELDGSHAPLLDGTAGDRIYWLAMPVATDYYSIAQAATAQIEMSNGGTTILGATPAAVPQRCVKLDSAEGQIAALLTAASLRGPGTLSSSFAITSANAPAFAIAEQQPLALTTHADVADHNVNISYGNPYLGETDEFQVGVANQHKISLGTGAAVAIYDSVSYYQTFTADACATLLTPDLSLIKLASAPVLAGAALTADNQLVVIDPAQPITMQVTVDPATELLVFLDEVSVQNGATAVSTVAIFFPLNGQFVVDPSLLAVGHTYLFYLQTRHGAAGAFAFDYRTLSYPVIVATTPTTTFTITR